MFYVNQGDELICVASGNISESPQLQIMGDDPLTIEQDGISAGETMLFYYQTNNGEIHAIDVDMNTQFAANGLMYIGSYSTSLVDCSSWCYYDFSYVNTGLNMTVFFTPNVASSLTSELGYGTIGAFYVNDDGGYSCAVSGVLSENPQLAVMADDVTTDHKDGMTVGEEIIWIYRTFSDEFYFLQLNPNETFTPNGMSFITSYETDLIICGCADTMSINYDPNVIVDNGTCEAIVYGCTNPNYIEYNAGANYDDGSCSIISIEGCTDSLYLEFNPEANLDNNTCLTLIVYGCMDSDYYEFDDEATVDDGSCLIISVEGCTDSLYLEYDENANTDNNSCITLIVEGCTNPGYIEYNSLANVDDGSCQNLWMYGCTDSLYLEYDENANTDDNSCATLIVYGCTDPGYYEYEDEATVDDGSCQNIWVYGCTDSLYMEFNPEANVNNSSCTTLIVYGCTDSGYDEYNEYATIDDGSCQTTWQVVINNLTESIDSLALEYEMLESHFDLLQDLTIETDLSLGWNIIAYTSYYPQNVEDATQEIEDIILILKNNDADVYIPEYNFNGIGDFVPGQGYQLKVSEAYEGFSFNSDYEFGCTNPHNSAYNPNALIDDGSCYTPYQIGDFAKGGIIYYIDESGEHGLVAAIEDIGLYEWGCYLDEVWGSHYEAIGTGNQNTMAIIDYGCTTSSPNFTNTAADEVVDYVHEGYTDWYLPSIDELEEMYYAIGPGSPLGNRGDFAVSTSGNWSIETKYWSSTSVSGWYGGSSYLVDFDTGEVSTLFKHWDHRVRPVRSF